MEQLTQTEMHQVTGGVTRKEYCTTVIQAIEHNWDRWTEHEQNSAVNAFHANCMQDWNQ